MSFLSSRVPPCCCCHRRRRCPENSNINQHVTKILFSDFDPSDFREFALLRSRWWRRTIELCIAPALDELQDSGDAMLVKYEDLVRIESRTNALLKMVEFLKVGSH